MKFFFTITFSVFCVFIMAQNTIEEQLITSKINQVNVFFNGAQIIRTAKININKGMSVFKVVGLSPFINPQTIQVKSKGVSIISVNHQFNYLNPVEQSPEIKALKEQLKIINNKIRTETVYLETNNEELLFLSENKKLTTMLNSVAFKNMQVYYITQIKNIKLKKIDYENNLQELKIKQQEIAEQIQSFLTKNHNSEKSSEIIIKLNADKTDTYIFEISYVTSHASWTPSYDIKVMDLKQPLQLTYKATIQQNTKEDWRDCKLNVSSINPNTSNIMPILYPYYIEMPTVFAKSKFSKLSPIMQSSEMPEATLRYEDTNTTTSFLAQPTEQLTSVSFDMPILSTIASDNKKHTLDLQTFMIPVEYKYYAVPKLSPHVFLSAYITEWEKYNLLNGDAHIFIENTYMGKTELDMTHTKDTLSLSLGVDESISIQRQSVLSSKSKQWIGGKQEIDKIWKTTIKNNKNQTILLMLLDQIPVSQNPTEIEVENIELSAGDLNKETGMVTWLMNILPQTFKEIILKYKVKTSKKTNIYVE